MIPLNVFLPNIALLNVMLLKPWHRKRVKMARKKMFSTQIAMLA
jgi:hypothetical protein